MDAGINRISAAISSDRSFGVIMCVVSSVRYRKCIAIRPNNVITTFFHVLHLCVDWQ